MNETCDFGFCNDRAEFEMYGSVIRDEDTNPDMHLCKKHTYMLINKTFTIMKIGMKKT